MHHRRQPERLASFLGVGECLLDSPEIVARAVGSRNERRLAVVVGNKVGKPVAVDTVGDTQHAVARRDKRGDSGFKTENPLAAGDDHVMIGVVDLLEVLTETIVSLGELGLNR